MKISHDPIVGWLAAWSAILIAAVLAMTLGGCATKPKPSVVITAPAITRVAEPVAKTKSAVEAARIKAVQLKPSVAPAGLPVFDEMQAQLAEAAAKADQAQAAVGQYQREVEKQSAMLAKVIDEKNEALYQVTYWQQKQAKALREIWMWRIIATVVVGSVLAFFGLRFAGKTLI